LKEIETYFESIPIVGTEAAARFDLLSARIEVAVQGLARDQGLHCRQSRPSQSRFQRLQIDRVSSIA
jgi:hypothetical protein